jgi:hypothetical protein
MAREPVTPLDRLLELAQAANRSYADDLLTDMRREIGTGGDLAPWAQAIQLARDLAALDADAAYFLLDMITETAVGLRIEDDPTVRVISDEMLAIERRDGLSEDEAYFLDQAPAAWEALNIQWERRFDVLQAELFLQYGERSMGTDLLTHPEEFRERSRRGWRMLLAFADEDEAS